MSRTRTRAKNKSAKVTKEVRATKTVKSLAEPELGFSFADLNKELKKIAPLGSTMDVSEFSEISEYIHTGNYLLNACLTGSLHRGYPNNRSVSLAGPSGVGKTFFMLNAAKNAQDMGYYIAWYDSENAVDKDLMVKFGLDPTKVWYEPVSTVEGFRTSILNLAQRLIDAKRKKLTIPKIMVFLDSAGNLASEKEMRDAESGANKADMTRAKMFKSVFRIIMTKLAEIKAPFVFANHTYQSQEMFSRTISSGGCLAPGSKIRMADDSLKNIEDIKNGDLVQTLDGNKKILQVWEFEKESIEVEFDNGTKLICSEDHRFYIGGDYMDNSSWIKAKDLVGNEKIIKCEVYSGSTVEN